MANIPPRGLVAIGALTLAIGMGWCFERFGSFDPLTGRVSCPQAPDEISAWARSHSNRGTADASALQRWLERHPDGVRSKYNASCMTPLHMAAQWGRDDLATLMLTHGANLGGADERGDAPLHTAATYGQGSVVTLLLSRGADVNARGNSGKTPLHSAVSGLGSNADARIDVARLLLDAGADVNATDRGAKFTPLRYSVGAGSDPSDKMTALLLSRGANASAADAQGTPLLNEAASAGNIGAVRLLIDHGADVNAQGKDDLPLSAAARGGYIEIVSLLLDRGAEVNRHVAGSRLEWQGLPLAHALVKLQHDDDENRMRRRREVARLLLARGAATDARSESGEPLLNRVASQGDLESLDLLMSHGATVTTRDAAGFTPLHRAVQQGRIDVVRRLVERGADVRAVTSDGKTPLDLASADPEMETLLRRHARK